MTRRYRKADLRERDIDTFLNRAFVRRSLASVAARKQRAELSAYAREAAIRAGLVQAATGETAPQPHPGQHGLAGRGVNAVTHPTQEGA